MKTPFREAKKVDERYVYSSADQSVFERISMRLNPSAIYQTLLQYGYESIISLDTPRGARYGYAMNLVCHKGGAKPAIKVQDCLDFSPLTEANVDAAMWVGRSVDGFHFDKGPIWLAWRSISTLLYKVIYKITVGRMMGARRQ